MEIALAPRTDQEGGVLSRQEAFERKTRGDQTNPFPKKERTLGTTVRCYRLAPPPLLILRQTEHGEQLGVIRIDNDFRQRRRRAFQDPPRRGPPLASRQFRMVRIAIALPTNAARYRAPDSCRYTGRAGG